MGRVLHIVQGAQLGEDDEVKRLEQVREEDELLLETRAVFLDVFLRSRPSLLRCRLRTWLSLLRRAGTAALRLRRTCGVIVVPGLISRRGAGRSIIVHSRECSSGPKAIVCSIRKQVDVNNPLPWGLAMADRRCWCWELQLYLDCVMAELELWLR